MPGIHLYSGHLWADSGQRWPYAVCNKRSIAIRGYCWLGEACISLFITSLASYRLSLLELCWGDSVTFFSAVIGMIVVCEEIHGCFRFSSYHLVMNQILIWQNYLILLRLGWASYVTKHIITFWGFVLPDTTSKCAILLGQWPLLYPLQLSLTLRWICSTFTW